RCHALRRRHRLHGSGGDRRVVWCAALEPLRAVAALAAHVRRAHCGASGIFPRPRTHRGNAVRRLQPGEEWPDEPGSLAAGPRRRAQGARRGALSMLARTQFVAAPVAARQALARELAAAISGEVRFDAGSRALYATDASNYRQVPIGVVLPRTKEDVMRTVEICRRHGAPILARGGGTSLCGQCCNVAVVLDFSKYLNRVLEIDPATKTARVEPGCVLDDLRNAAAKHGLTFAPDPATHTHNTLGGMIGNNSCGPHSVMGGETVDNVIELEVLTYDGARMTLGAGDEQPTGRQAEIYGALRR